MDRTQKCSASENFHQNFNRTSSKIWTIPNLYLHRKYNYNMSSSHNKYYWRSHNNIEFSHSNYIRIISSKL